MCSVLTKIDLIQAELSTFDIVTLSETWPKPTTNTNDIRLEGYHVTERTDLITDGYGDVIVYVTNSIYYKRRKDLEGFGTENIWIELIMSHNKHLLIGLFYRPPNSSQDTDTRIENSIDLAPNTGIQNIVIIGDFNLNPSVPTLARKHV